MSAKLIYTLTDSENPDLQKQIGCMNGFFQLFDRQHRIARHGRLNNGQPQKRLPQPPPGQNGNQEVEANNRLEKPTGKDSKKVVKERNSKKDIKEKRKNSTESSRHSFSSSSCSSSFSSLDYNKAANPEPSPSSQNSSSETPSRDFSVNQPTGAMQFSRKSLDLRDVIKDSMHREARGLSVKTVAKEEAAVHTLKFVDSPRPLEPPKSAKPRNVGVNDSFRVFSKFQEGTLNSNEEKDRHTRWGPKDLRRLSYDGRESQDILKSTIKLKELPRLSLDSRQGCIRSTTTEAKPSSLLNDLRIEKRNSDEMANLLQEPGSSKRASSVVAKLMGLVDPMPISDNPLRQENALETKKDPLSRSLRTTSVNMQDHFSGSPRNSHKDLNSCNLKNADSVTKMDANQRFPIETAPWRQQHGKRNRGPQAPPFKCQEAPPKITTTPLTVYGEIEKRLSDLEFKKSGKDLRALKQILEAMQKTKDASDNKKDQKFASQANYDDSLDSSSNLSNSSIPPTTRVSKAAVSNKSSIVIMKPAKLMGRGTESASAISSIDNLVDLRKHDSADNRKASVDKRTTKHLTARNTRVTCSFNQQHNSQDKSSNTRTAKSAQASKLPDSEEKSVTSGRVSGTMSPRLHQRRLGLEKHSPPASQSDSGGRRRHGSRQPTECSSPGRKCKPQLSKTRRTNEQWRDTGINGRYFCHQDNANSLQSASNISLTSEDIDNEVTSMIRPDQISSIYFEQNSRKHKNPTSGFSVNKKITEPGRATSEQPSPISVLDATFYRDDSPSPVKKTSNAFKDYEIPYPDEMEWVGMDLDQQSNGTKSSLSIEVDQRIHEMNCTNMEPIIAESFFCDSTNPDHIYISDILSASDLSRKLESGWMNIPFHSSGHLINPKLFFALEQPRAGTRLLYDEQGGEKTLQQKPDWKIHRKLVFDVVNEILVRKLVVTDSFTQWLLPDKLARKEQRGQQLLRELCSEVDQLQGKNSISNNIDDEEDSLRSIICEDMTHWPMNMTEYGRQIPAVVLDLERLIFKDLITELVNGESASLHGRSGGHCKKLFFK